jgi:hypothetical protein
VIRGGIEDSDVQYSQCHLPVAKYYGERYHLSTKWGFSKSHLFPAEEPHGRVQGALDGAHDQGQLQDPVGAPLRLEDVAGHEREDLKSGRVFLVTSRKFFVDWGARSGVRQQQVRQQQVQQ